MIVFWLQIKNRYARCGVRLLYVVLCAALCAACGATTPSLVAPEPAAQGAPVEQSIPAAVAALATRVRPCATAGAPGTTADGAPVALGTQQGAAVSQPPSETITATAALIHYDDPTNTILVRRGAQTTLAGVSGVISRSNVLRELSSGEWLLAANLKIEAGAALRIAAPEVRWLKLRSDAGVAVWIKALGGQLEFADTCVSSWDESQSSYDENYHDGRSFVLARDGGRMTIRNSDLRYLGYDGPGSYGVAWHTAGTTGEIVDSFVSYSYYGVYASGVHDLLIRGNETHHNVIYGIDLHTRALRLAIENNVAHDNGKHGIMLAEESSDSLVRNNVVYNNLHHGIVIYRRSNNNLVEDNIAYGNGGHGININDAANAMVRNNTVYDNLQAGIGVGQQSGTTQVISNSVRANRRDGIVLYSNVTDSVLRDNTIGDNARYGLYVKSAGNASVEGNQIFGNAVGVYLNMAGPLEVSQQTNQIHGNREADLRRASDAPGAGVEGDQP